MQSLVRVVNAAGMMVLPVLLGVYLARRTRASWPLFAAGAGTFLFSQLLHLPFNRFLLLPGLEAGGFGVDGDIQTQLLFALALGLSAGVFEEFSRYIVLRFGAKSARDWKSALMFGAGHSGVEAFLLGGIALAALIQVSAYNTPAYLNSLPEDQRSLLVSQIELYWSIPWATALLGLVERVFALCFHISAAVLVMQVFLRRNNWWLLAAVLWHTLLDATAVLINIRAGAFAAEGALAGLTVISALIIFTLRPVSSEGTTPSEQVSPEQPDQSPVPRVPENTRIQERINDSRYE
ncbi:MAG: YhfC family intramembrane metalloprotease [Anaerolineales bacterium]|nr:YhfC family intramembrane metalloprotease [Anaerolineales bacterium]